MDEPVVEKSELALLIEQRERKLYPFDVAGFLGLGGKEVPRLGFRSLKKIEENSACEAAHVTVEKYAKGDKDTRADNDLLDDLKLCECLQRACYLPDQKTKNGHPIQAFPGGRWLEENFSTEEIAVLHNHLLEVCKAESPMLWDIKLEDVMSLAEGCAKAKETDLPETMLSVATREWLTTAFVLLASEWWVLREKVLVLEDVIQGEDRGERVLPESEVDSSPGVDAGQDGSDPG